MHTRIYRFTSCFFQTIALLCVFSFSSCTTYYIPVDSFKKQFAFAGSLQPREVTTRGPGGDKVTYKTYQIDSIACVDKKGNPAMLKNSPSIEIRFTDSSNRKTIFYFDLLHVTDSTIRGGQSRFIPSLHKTIRISTVKLIEVQDGKKDFHYVP